MTTIDDGGPAFPGFSHTPGYGCSKRNVQGEFEEHTTGMTLRDYLAAKAMQGLLATGDFHGNQSASRAAEEAYHFADAMILEKTKADNILKAAVAVVDAAYLVRGGPAETLKQDMTKLDAALAEYEKVSGLKAPAHPSEEVPF